MKAFVFRVHCTKDTLTYYRLAFRLQAPRPRARSRARTVCKHRL